MLWAYQRFRRAIRRRRVAVSLSFQMDRYWSAILDGLFMTHSVAVVDITSPNSVSGISLPFAITCQVMKPAALHIIKNEAAHQISGFRPGQFPLSALERNMCATCQPGHRRMADADKQQEAR